MDSVWVGWEYGVEHGHIGGLFASYGSAVEWLKEKAREQEASNTRMREFFAAKGRTDEGAEWVVRWEDDHHFTSGAGWDHFEIYEHPIQP